MKADFEFLGHVPQTSTEEVYVYQEEIHLWIVQRWKKFMGSQHSPWKRGEIGTGWIICPFTYSRIVNP